MKKVIVIGSPGAGKTTFAEKLNEHTGLPLIHLDAIWHKSDRTHISREEFDKRLDEIGAMGIVRTFSSGGARAQEVYKEGQEALDEVAFATYSKDGNSCINEFYDRLLKLKDLMNTETGAKLAEKRHNYMMNFLVEFYQEWKGLK